MLVCVHAGACVPLYRTDKCASDFVEDRGCHVGAACSRRVRSDRETHHIIGGEGKNRRFCHQKMPCVRSLRLPF